MNVIIVGCHKGLTRNVIKTLIECRIKFSYIGPKYLIQSVALSKYCKAVYEIEENDLHVDSMKTYEVIKPLIRDTDMNYVIPTGIRSTLYISKNVREIEGYKNYYPIADYQTIAMLNNKWDFYLFLENNTILTPKTILFNPLEFETMKNNLSFPLMTKALDSENSRNVNKVDNLNELSDVTSKSTIPLLIQDYIQGYDINLYLFCVEGEIKAYTMSRRTEKGIIFENNDEVLNIGRKIVKLLHFTGLINFDLRYNEVDGTFRVLECNPRVWGSLLHSFYVGVNFMHIALNHQHNDCHFEIVKSGTTSINLKYFREKLWKFALSKQDLQSILLQSKLFVHDPIYEINFLLR